MIIKKYVVDEMQEAVKKIREELGPEAIIVSNQKVRGKGVKGFFQAKVEVTAVLDEAKGLATAPKAIDQKPPTPALSPPALATDPKHQPRQEHPEGQGHQAQQEREEHQGHREKEIVSVSKMVRTTAFPNDAAQVHAIRSNPTPLQFKPVLEEEMIKKLEQEERRRMLTMLEQQLEKVDQDNKDFHRHWLELLTNLDIEQGIAQELLTGVAEKVVHLDADERQEFTKITLTSKIADLIKPAYQQVDQAKHLIFIGQPGVGKTTSLAKLATRFKLLEGKKIALITVYSYRYGTADQLKVYGETMDVPVEVVMTPAELRQAVERHADKDYILIDTIGRSSRNTGQVLELKSFIEAIEGPKQTFLVLSASNKNRDLFRTIDDFKIIHYNRYIFTKVDETETLGSMLNVVLKTGIPVQYYSAGQAVPEDIAQVQPRQLAQLLFKGVDLDAGQSESN